MFFFYFDAYSDFFCFAVSWVKILWPSLHMRVCGVSNFKEISVVHVNMFTNACKLVCAYIYMGCFRSF